MLFYLCIGPGQFNESPKRPSSTLIHNIFKGYFKDFRKRSLDSFPGFREFSFGLRTFASLGGRKNYASALTNTPPGSKFWS
jgi:hypothetical protein